MAHVAIDWNKYMEGLAGKANIALNNCPANIDFVVESRINDNGTWYRLYKSGWLEQGGAIRVASSAVGTEAKSTITFAKPFKDTSYNIQVSSSVGASGWQYANGAYVETQGTTNFQVVVPNGSGTVYLLWFACGTGANFSHEGVLPSEPGLEDLLG